MKTRIKFIFTVVLLASFLGFFESCKDRASEQGKEIALNDTNINKEPKKEVSKEFKKYWYSGVAEITSYKLEQARYGEIREGKSVLIYVTEPFVADKQVKADRSNASNVPILKLNSTKKYLTGIYPYSIMSSSFYPVHDNQHAIKVTFSAQEWCGQVYAQLNNREKFEISSFSYFESEGDKKLFLEKNILENELWNKIRINPSDLPVGELKIVPSLEYIRLSHKALKPYKAIASLSNSNGKQTYTITYPELDRTLDITFNEVFPYEIESWQDAFKSGFGKSAKVLVSKATKIKTLKTAYWQQNGNAYTSLRDTLGL